MHITVVVIRSIFRSFHSAVSQISASFGDKHTNVILCNRLSRCWCVATSCGHWLRFRFYCCARFFEKRSTTTDKL